VYAPVNGLQLYYEVHGEGRPTLLLNGAEEIRAIPAPMLIVVGDSDIIRLEHAVELFGLRGGGVMGDFGGMPDSQLAVLPGTSHFLPEGSGVLDHAELLFAAIRPFLDAD
jgi:pimeloyl-ACP methyl ester carboxylesterase